MVEPTASRPSPDWLGGKELLPWSWARDRLTAERNYWVVTVRRDRFPQARPVWGVWMDDLLFMSVGHAGIQRAALRDAPIRGEPPESPITIHVDSAVDVVIVEGSYRRATAFAGPGTDTSPVGGLDEKTLSRALDLYNRKYEWNLQEGWLNFLVRPRLVYGWRDEDIKTATRWSFL